MVLLVELLRIESVLKQFAESQKTVITWISISHNFDPEENNVSKTICIKPFWQTQCDPKSFMLRFGNVV